MLRAARAAEKRGKEDDGNHDRYLRLSKDAGSGSHGGYDQADLAARDHAAADAEASNLSPAAANAAMPHPSNLLMMAIRKTARCCILYLARRAEFTLYGRNKQKKIGNINAFTKGTKSSPNVASVYFDPAQTERATGRLR